MVTKGFNVANLTKVVMQALLIARGLTCEIMSSKLLCFGANGASVVQSARTRITKQIQ
jgi:hypothetical protein